LTRGPLPVPVVLLAELVSVAVATNDTVYDYDFTYDPIGNRRTSVTKETGTTITTTYTTSQLNQYTAITSRTNPTYDEDGNMTLLPDATGDWTLSWNGENRLIAAESSSAKPELKYDYMGRRVERNTHAGTTGNWTGPETRRFFYNGWNLIGSSPWMGRLSASTGVMPGDWTLLLPRPIDPPLCLRAFVVNPSPSCLPQSEITAIP
jgi:YD repeat-containing protein